MANKYWVNNGGDISDNANHISDSSGGSPGADYPISTDNLIFDENSFSLSRQVITIENQQTEITDFNTINVTNMPEFRLGYFSLTIHGDFRVKGCTIKNAGAQEGVIELVGSGVIETNGVFIGVAIIQNDGSYSLSDDLNIIQMIIGQGPDNNCSFNANDKNVDFFNFQATTASGIINMGNGDWTLKYIYAENHSYGNAGLMITGIDPSKYLIGSNCHIYIDHSIQPYGYYLSVASNNKLNYLEIHATTPHNEGIYFAGDLGNVIVSGFDGYLNIYADAEVVLNYNIDSLTIIGDNSIIVSNVVSYLQNVQITAKSVSLRNVEFRCITAQGDVNPWVGTNLIDGERNYNIDFPDTSLGLHIFINGVEKTNQIKFK
jgi:hypothetical protein